MREFKFRAWYKKEKIMLNVIGEVYSECFPYDFTKSKNLVLMQYTGLKDKNGKEIYEGDIVVWIDNDGNKHQNMVFFERGAFRICNSYFEISEYGELEVVGNIYENPELLGDD